MTATLTHGSLFTGYGGLDMAIEAVTGARTVWHAEFEPSTEKIPNPKQAGARLLAHRYPGVPNHGDVTAIDWANIEPVDIISGGSPCQDVSAAGRRAGMRAGTRSGLWTSMVTGISIIRPRLVVWENVRGVLSADADCALEPCPGCVGDGDNVPTLRALGRVLGDLADIGYDASWYGLPASEVGCCHGRFRIFVVAWPAADPFALGSEPRRSASRRTAGPHGEPDRRSHSVAADTDCDGWSGRAEASAVGRPHGSGSRCNDQGRGLGAVADTHGIGGGTDVGDLPARESDADGLAVADADGDALRQQPVAVARRSSAAVAGLAGPDTAADADSDGQSRVGRVDPVGPDADRRGGAFGVRHEGEPASSVADTVGGGRDGGSPIKVGQTQQRAAVAWGRYEPAVRGWERLTRPAPLPWEVGPKGGNRLSPAFPEWMMGLPAGHVTAVPGLTRNEQLKLIGNGVVPQQAATGIVRALDVAPAWVLDLVNASLAAAA